MSVPVWDWTPPIELDEVDAYMWSVPNTPYTWVDPLDVVEKLTRGYERGTVTFEELRERTEELSPPGGFGRLPARRYERLVELDRWAYEVRRDRGELRPTPHERTRWRPGLPAVAEAGVTG